MTTVRMMSTSSRSSSSGSAPQERREQESKDGGAVSSGSGKPCCGASSSHSSHTATTAQKEAGKGTRGGKGAAGGFLSRELLSKFTVAASILCAIDCTVFPALLAILPAAEVLGDPQWGGVDLHELSHQAALYVVLPIGALGHTAWRYMAVMKLEGSVLRRSSRSSKLHRHRNSQFDRPFPFDPCTTPLQAASPRSPTMSSTRISPWRRSAAPDWPSSWGATHRSSGSPRFCMRAGCGTRWAAGH